MGRKNIDGPPPTLRPTGATPTISTIIHSPTAPAQPPQLPVTMAPPHPPILQPEPGLILHTPDPGQWVCAHCGQQNSASDVTCGGNAAMQGMNLVGMGCGRGKEEMLSGSTLIQRNSMRSSPYPVAAPTGVGPNAFAPSRTGVVATRPPLNSIDRQTMLRQFLDQSKRMMNDMATQVKIQQMELHRKEEEEEQQRRLQEEQQRQLQEEQQRRAQMQKQQQNQPPLHQHQLRMQQQLPPHHQQQQQKQQHSMQQQEQQQEQHEHQQHQTMRHQERQNTQEWQIQREHHDASGLRRKPKRQTLCRFLQQPFGCMQGDDCEWAHTQAEIDEAMKPWTCVFCGLHNPVMSSICGGRGEYGVTPGCKKHINQHFRELKKRQQQSGPSGGVSQLGCLFNGRSNQDSSSQSEAVYL
eukprot:gnl/MRDRNA2_/MRDRNA2_124672_c0_seq1.p1 gnl/MRDRNA2_/MRDRNA2_124672_c0~~gnl/MRDRNA2_/MRDRNA2_124672_c0_seq1.p1  ORF type:complete len:443 (+),score=94.60 gnl/MRDRNA2_/MRDRNA2_124672_c0_seq1:105-1331(+)